ncbi:MAG: hypothetical protein V3U96_05940 [Paracoccaceae bacterium]
MSDLKVTKTRFFAGVWEGVITGANAQPDLEVSHLGAALKFELSTSENAPNALVLRIPVPADLLSDGVQVFLISNKTTGRTLNSFTIIAGEPLEDDIRAETELLRAELDMLKKAFRRHCLETS